VSHIDRRSLLQGGLGTFALGASSGRSAYAQGYPDRNVRWIVGAPPGGALDYVARTLGQWLQDRLGKPFIIENRPAGGGNVAGEAVVQAAPDGYTLLLVSQSMTVYPSLYVSPKYDIRTDFSPIVLILELPLLMVVNPKFPAKTVPEFIAYAKANPGKINMASAGNGTTPHLAGELFNVMAGVKMVHVPYRGGAAAITDLLAGQVDVMFDFISNSIGLVRQGQLRGLAVTSLTRSDALPDLPTVSDSVPNFEASTWVGFAAPKGTPTDIISLLNREVTAGLKDPAIEKKFNDLGAKPVGGTPEEFGKFLAGDVEKWAKVVNFTGLKAE